MRILHKIIFIIAVSILVKTHLGETTNLKEWKDEFMGFSMPKSYFKNTELEQKDLDMVYESIIQDFSNRMEKKYLKIIVPISELLNLSFSHMRNVNFSYRESILYQNIQMIFSYPQPVLRSKNSIKLLKCLIRTDEEHVYFHFLLTNNSNL